MTKHGIAKRYGVNRAERNSILKVILIEEAVREYLKAEPRTLRLSLERLCDAIDREEAEKRRGEDKRGTMFARAFVGWHSIAAWRDLSCNNNNADPSRAGDSAQKQLIVRS
jgi:hypothetical protein